MSQLSLGELQNYSNWVGKSAAQIKASVKRVGGWTTVFPKQLPLWAHRVRNYFNIEPTYLTRLDAAQTKVYMSRIRAGLDELQHLRDIKNAKSSSFSWIKNHPEVKDVGVPDYIPDGGVLDALGEDNALYRYVYRDLQGNIWYQMDAGGTIYHWGEDPWVASVEALWQSKWRGQAITPVFKLVSPDNTEGSLETIIKNPPVRTVEFIGQKFKIGRWSIEEVGVMKYVINEIITDLWYQGSYNFSETVVIGMGNHERRDVNPHTKFKRDNIYVNPPNRFASLDARFFPAVANGERNLIANQNSLKDIF